MDSPPPADVLPPVPDPYGQDTLRGWLRLNGLKLLLLAAAAVAVCWNFYVADVLLAGFGLSLIIFLHELGHFLAAKACDVHVRTFSIGFGPPLPFCQFRYGETTYKLGMVPLGGFVAMVGENTGETDADAKANDKDDDPRSFKNKPVWQRMVIISAGVVMNLILAATCFIVAYMNGVEDKPALVGSIEPGSALWRAGVRPGTEITRLNGMSNPGFDDIKPYVMATHKGDTVTIDTLYKGQRESLVIEPLKSESALFPQLGFLSPSSMTLVASRRDATPPYQPGSAASKAVNAAGGAGFLGGDTIVAMSDPRHPETTTPLDPGECGVPHIDYANRLAKLAGKTIRFQVRRASGETAELSVPPAFHKDTGLRMKMGPVVAVRTGSPAALAEVKTRVVAADKELEPGDRIVSVEFEEPGGRKTLLSVDAKVVPSEPNTRTELLDPLRLPFELNGWAERTGSVPDRKVNLVVLRHVDHTDKNVPLTLGWDDSYRQGDDSHSASTPVKIGGLGLAYRVTSEVNYVVPDSPAAKADIRPGDVIVAAGYKVNDPKKGEIAGKVDQIEEKPGEAKPKLLQWAFADYGLQVQAPHKMVLTIDRLGQEVKVDELAAVDDPSFPVAASGLYFREEFRLQKADSVGEALGMGYRRTLRAIRATYQSLYGMVFGRISVKMMSGPITLARASYILAGEDAWKLVLLVGLISINLAVVNFLPIPVLDGGHMVFLIYEGVFRRPAPEIVQVILTWVGLIAVLGMMAFTIGLDVWRLWQR